MQPPADGPELHGLASDGVPDWEAFYRDYRKPSYVEGFEITTKLGGGMFGLVFRARRMSIGKDYAIKFLKVDDGEVRRAVLSELEQVKYFAQIDHPNLVSIEDRGEVSGIPYLVMAFAGTETLRDRMTASDIAEGKPPGAEDKAELVRAFLQCCRGLQALHERSLVHFDIKPANVFLKGGVARLGDYGLSKLVTHSRGSLSMGRGTPYYMAPEMLQRRGDARSDIYSLGVMLYEILCGKVPFTGDSEWEVLRQHENAQPVLMPHLTAVERKVLQGCLAKQPEARFQSVEQLLAAFGQVSPTNGMPVAMAVAASLPAAPLPTCVPPPLPRPAVPPRKVQAAKASSAEAPWPAPPSPSPSPRRRAARARQSKTPRVRFGAIVIVLLVLLGGTLLFGMRTSRVTSIEIVERSGDSMMTQVQTSLQNATLSSVRDLAQVQVVSALANGRRAAQRNRPQKLRQINFSAVQVPDDFAAYRGIVDPLAESARFVPALASRAEQLGRPTMLTAVAMLQELDYHDGRACRRAENLQRLLAQMTGIDKLVVEVAGPEPSPTETCMFHAVADGWRVIVERCAADDRMYEELLSGVHRADAAAEAWSPR